MSMQDDMNMEWLSNVLEESLKQWNDFKEDRANYTVEDFVEFTKEIARDKFCVDTESEVDE